MTAPAKVQKVSRLNLKRRSSKKRQAVEREGYVCHLCDLSIPEKSTGLWGFTLDHKIPRALGGSNSSENLLPAHRFCNELKRDSLDLTEVQLLWVYRKAIRDGMCRDSVREQDYEILAQHE